MKGAMHTPSTLDYIFIIDGTIELGMASGETRILKKGDSAVQRATTHWWRNTSRTEPAIMAAVSVGIEGAVEDEMRIVGVVPEGDGKEKGE
jgi:quercetin dioxygenase-like cupin family protein